VLRGDCRTFALRNARLPQRIPVTATRPVQSHMPVTLQRSMAIPAQALAWLGGQAPAIAALVFVGIAVPPIGQLLKPSLLKRFFCCLHILHARGYRSAARSSAPARHCAGGDGGPRSGCR
jgi:hypothetical protein